MKPDSWKTLDKGADVNSPGNFYGNALYVASLRGYQEIVKLLLDKGADVNAQDTEYDNVLRSASEGGHQEIVKPLQGRGAITSPSKPVRLQDSKQPGEEISSHGLRTFSSNSVIRSEAPPWCPAIT